MRSVMGVSRNHLIPYPLRHLLISTCVPRSLSPLLQIAHHIHHVSAASIRTCFREDAIPGRVYPRRISNAIRPERGPSPGTCPHYYALFSYTLELSFGGSALLSPFPYHAAVGWIFDGKAVNWIESKWTNWLSLLPGRSHPSSSPSIAARVILLGYSVLTSASSANTLSILSLCLCLPSAVQPALVWFWVVIMRGTKSKSQIIAIYQHVCVYSLNPVQYLYC